MQESTMSYRTDLLLLALPLVAIPVVTVAAAEPPANHLARESSPYLLQHAHNPVDWYPWGAEAFAKAKKEDKLVFLSIGYSSCHWCHVMERESFDNEEVAKILNDHFVCIKVDREERPDIDDIYMTALNVLGKHGGWPLSMFLTRRRQAHRRRHLLAAARTGGRRRDGARASRRILKTVVKIRADKRKDLDDQADRLAADTARVLAGRPSASPWSSSIASWSPARSMRSAGGIRSGLTAASARRPASFGERSFPAPPYLRFLRYEAASGRNRPTSSRWSR